MNGKKLVYCLVCLGNVTISFNLAAIVAALPVMSQDLSVSAFELKDVLQYYMIPYGLGALMYAPLTKKFSYRAILSVSMVLFAVSCFVCATAQSLNPLVLGRVGMGLTAGGAIPLGLMIIGEFFDKEIRGRLVGMFFSASFMANLVGIFCLAFIGWRWLFFIPCILAIVLSGSIMLIGKELKKVHGISVNYITSLRNIKILKIFIWIFVISFLYHAVQKWYGVYMSHEYGLDKKAISFMIMVSMLGGFFGQNVGGFLSDKKSRYFTCVIGIYGLAASVMCLKGHYPSWGLAVLLFLITMFWTIGHNGVSTILTDASSEDRPVMASLNSCMRFLPGGIGVFVSGLFVEKSFGMTFFSIGILMIVLSLFLKVLVPSPEEGTR